MQRVVGNMVTYDASVGRIEIGQEYLVEDDKAERWIQSGIATLAKDRPATPPPEPEPEPEPEEDSNGTEADDDADDDPVALAAEAHKLHAEGASERAIAQQLGISRTRVHTLLQVS
jgi:transposase